MLNLGGIDNRPPKANQTNGKFRVARNVYPTPDGRIIPRYDGDYAAGQPSVSQYSDFANYNGSILKVSHNSNYTSSDLLSVYRDDTLIPRPYIYADVGDPVGYRQQSGMNYRMNNTTYFLDMDRGLLKYDGVQITRCGNTTPNIGCAEYTTTGTLKYIRVIKHRVDFDNNETLSEYVQFPVLAGTTSTNLNIKSGVSITPLINGTNPQVIPTSVAGNNVWGYPDNEFVGVPLYQPDTFDFLIGNPAGRSGVANGTITITGLPRTSDLYVGMNVTWVGILANTRIVSIVSSSSITLTSIVPSGTLIFSFNRDRPATGAGTITLTGIPNTADLRVGMMVTSVSGAVIPANSIIASIVSGTSITLNNIVPAGALVLRVLTENTMAGYVTPQIGSYVFVRVSSTPLNTFISPSVTGVALGVALKIKSVVGTFGNNSITLDLFDAYYMNSDREWVKTNLSSNATLMNAFATATKWGCSEFLTVWASTSASGIYYYYGTQPYIVLSSLYPTTAIPIAIPQIPSAVNALATSNTSLATLTVALGDMYDTYSRKLSPNSSANFGGILYSSFYCMAVYQSMLLLANDDLIWFSDTTLGGNFEQFNSLNFLRIGDSEFGRITSICGTNDFFVVCRERKNYYVNGNISTGNYRVQEISTAEIGAWSNSSSVLVKDSVIFLTAVGVFQVTDGGQCVKISESCPKNFSTYDSMNVNEDVSFKMQGFVSAMFDPDPFDLLEYRDGLAVSYDEYRELLVFMKRDSTNACFVLHTKTGEFYEWDGLVEGTISKFGNCITFIDSKFYVGEIDMVNPSYTAKIKSENKSISLSYPVNHPIKLYSTWLTAGEPSLEKSLLQLKLFGRIQSDGTTSSINVCHYKNWDISTKITNSAYYPHSPALSLDNQVQYSHKKRFNSDKVLATSVGFEVNSGAVTFEIESFEVEFNQIQGEMKK